ncbi:MAG TPA: phasin family protein [Beijerinckiaceae bacterium]|mgnify:CR=1 FL=1|nr:phasin family protein [Beijerinckiaceae bacterium]
MAKKLKALAGGSNETHLAQTIKDSAHQIWLAGLGAFAKAQEEGTKVFEALVKEGEKIQTKTREVAEDKIAEARKAASGTWDKLESVFEERVARALHSLNVPTKKDIDLLTQRVHELTASTKKLSGTVQTEAKKTSQSVSAKAQKVLKQASAATDEAAEVVSTSAKKVLKQAGAVKDDAAELVTTSAKIAKDEAAKVIASVKAKTVG